MQASSTPDGYLSAWQVGVLLMNDPSWSSIAEFARRNLPLWHGYYHQSHPAPAPYRGGTRGMASLVKPSQARSPSRGTVPASSTPTSGLRSPQRDSNPTVGAGLSRWRGVARDPQHGVPFSQREVVHRGIDTVGAAVGMGPRFRDFSSPHYFLDNYGLFPKDHDSSPVSTFEATPAFNPHVLAGVALLHYRLASNAQTYLMQLNAQFPNVRAEGNPQWSIPLRPMSSVDELAFKNLDSESSESVQRHVVLQSPKLRTLILSTLWDALPKDGRHQLPYTTFHEIFLTPVLRALCVDVVGVAPGQPLPSSLVHDVVSQDWFLRTEFGETAALDPTQFAFTTTAMLDAWAVTNTFEEFSELIHVMTAMVKAEARQYEETAMASSGSLSLSYQLGGGHSPATTPTRAHSSVLEGSIIKRRRSSTTFSPPRMESPELDVVSLQRGISIQIDADGADAERKRRLPLPEEKPEEMLVAGIIQCALGDDRGTGTKRDGRARKEQDETTKSLVSFVRSMTHNVQRYEDYDDFETELRGDLNPITSSSPVKQPSAEAQSSSLTPPPQKERPQTKPTAISSEFSGAGSRRSITFVKTLSSPTLPVHREDEHNADSTLFAVEERSVHISDTSPTSTFAAGKSSDDGSDSGSEDVSEVVGTLLRRQQSVAIMTQKSMKEARREKSLARFGGSRSSASGAEALADQVRNAVSMRQVAPFTATSSKRMEASLLGGGEASFLIAGPMLVSRSEFPPIVVATSPRGVYELYSGFMRRQIRRSVGQMVGGAAPRLASSKSLRAASRRKSLSQSAMGSGVGAGDPALVGRFTSIIRYVGPSPDSPLPAFKQRPPLAEGAASPTISTAAHSEEVGSFFSSLPLSGDVFGSVASPAGSLKAEPVSSVRASSVPHAKVMSQFKTSKAGLAGNVHFRPPSKMSLAFQMWGPNPMNTNAHSTYVMGGALGGGSSDDDEPLGGGGDLSMESFSIREGSAKRPPSGGPVRRRSRQKSLVPISPRCFSIDELKWKCDCGAGKGVHRLWCASYTGASSLAHLRRQRVIPLLAPPLEVGRRSFSRPSSLDPAKDESTYPYVRWYLVQRMDMLEEGTQGGRDSPFFTSPLISEIVRHAITTSEGGGSVAESPLAHLLSVCEALPPPPRSPMFYPTRIKSAASARPTSPPPLGTFNLAGGTGSEANFTSLALSISELNPQLSEGREGSASQPLSPLLSKLESESQRSPQTNAATGNKTLYTSAIPLSQESNLRLTLAYLVHVGDEGELVSVESQPNTIGGVFINAHVDPLTLSWASEDGARNGLVVGVVHNGTALFEYATDNRLAWCPVPSHTPLQKDEPPQAGVSTHLPTTDVHRTLTNWLAEGVLATQKISPTRPTSRASTSVSMRANLRPGSAAPGAEGTVSSRPCSRDTRDAQLMRLISTKLMTGVDVRYRQHFLCADISSKSSSSKAQQRLGGKGGRAASNYARCSLISSRPSTAERQHVRGGPLFRFSLVSKPVVETVFSSKEQVMVPRSLEGKDVSLPAIAGAIAKGSRHGGPLKTAPKRSGRGGKASVAPLTQTEAELMLHLLKGSSKGDTTSDQFGGATEELHVAPVRASVLVIAPLDRTSELETALQRQSRLRNVHPGKISLNSTLCGEDPRREAISITYTRKGLPVPSFLSHPAAEDQALVLLEREDTPAVGRLGEGHRSTDAIFVEPLIPMDEALDKAEGRVECYVYVPLDQLLRAPQSLTQPPVFHTEKTTPSPPVATPTSMALAATPAVSIDFSPPLGARQLPPLLEARYAPSPSQQLEITTDLPLRPASVKVNVPAVAVSASCLPWRTITTDPTLVPTRTVDAAVPRRLPKQNRLCEEGRSQSALRAWRSEKAKMVQTPEVAASDLPSVEKILAQRAARQQLRRPRGLAGVFHPKERAPM